MAATPNADRCFTCRLNAQDGDAYVSLDLAACGGDEEVAAPVDTTAEVALDPAPEPVPTEPEPADAPEPAVVGTGASGHSGDGGPALDADLDEPEYLAFDAAGNLYFSQRGNGTIRKVDTDGIITTIGGTGQSGDAGDGGPATEADLLVTGGGIAVGPDGSLCLNTSISKIRRIDPDGIISTLGGAGSGDPGDGGAATEMRLAPLGFDLDQAGNLLVGNGQFTTGDGSLVLRIGKVTF